MFLLNSRDELRKLLRDQPSLWLPDNLLLLQEYFPVDAAQGIVRMEFLGGKLLYAMRVVSNGAFNLCPSETCNPEATGNPAGGNESRCAIPARAPAKPVEFYPYEDVPAAAVEMGERIMESGGLDVGGIEDRRQPTAGKSSTTSTQIPTSVHRLGTRSDSIHLSASWIT